MAMMKQSTPAHIFQAQSHLDSLCIYFKIVLAYDKSYDFWLKIT